MQPDAASGMAAGRQPAVAGSQQGPAAAHPALRSVATTRGAGAPAA